MKLSILNVCSEKARDALFLDQKNNINNLLAKCLREGTNIFEYLPLQMKFEHCSLVINLS